METEFRVRTGSAPRHHAAYVIQGIRREYPFDTVAVVVDGRTVYRGSDRGLDLSQAHRIWLAWSDLMRTGARVVWKVPADA